MRVAGRVCGSARHVAYVSEIASGRAYAWKGASTHDEGSRTRAGRAPNSRQAQGRGLVAPPRCESTGSARWSIRWHETPNASEGAPGWRPQAARDA